jgi:isoquinoline 1-oxidoreductase beta subunit
VIFGLSAALHGEISIERGRVVQGNYHDYRPLRMAECPVIETDIVSRTEAPCGIGETGLPPLAPAVANAVFALTGIRLRSLPLRLPDLGPYHGRAGQPRRCPCTINGRRMTLERSPTHRCSALDSSARPARNWLWYRGVRHVHGAVDGAPVACVTPLPAIADRTVTTIEGASGTVAEAVQAAWTTLDVPQCGYCQSP